MYLFEAKVNLRPDIPLTRNQQADLLAEFLNLMRKYDVNNSGGGFRLMKVDASIGDEEE